MNDEFDIWEIKDDAERVHCYQFFYLIDNSADAIIYFHNERNYPDKGIFYPRKQGF
jgi:hypothetical protein